MPFTLSHPTAAVPFARFGLPLSALVVGSMAPDFPYFLLFSTKNQFGHTIAGVFWFCLPVGVMALALLHGFWKRPLLSLLPESHQAKLAPVAEGFRFLPASAFLRIVVALILGAFTHLIWDSLTHANGWTVRHVPLLGLPVLQTAHTIVPLFKLFQHGSTLLGILLLTLWYSRWFRQAIPTPLVSSQRLSAHSRTRILVATAAVAVAAGMLYGFLSTTMLQGSKRLPLFARGFVMAGAGTLAVEFSLFSAAWHHKATGRRNGYWPVDLPRNR